MTESRSAVSERPRSEKGREQNIKACRHTSCSLSTLISFTSTKHQAHLMI